MPMDDSDFQERDLHEDGNDSDSSFECINKEIEEAELQHSLAEWAVENNVSHVATGSLLEILKKHHPHLPKDARTLLSTQRMYSIHSKAGGSYFHFGVASCIQKELSSLPPDYTISSLELQVNIDGLPLFKSSRVQFWPILGRLVKPLKTKVFIIGLFCGNDKPQNVDEYLSDFITEMLIIKEMG